MQFYSTCRQPQCNKPMKRKILLWNKVDLSSLRYDFNMFSSNFVLQSFPDVNSCLTVLRNKVIQLIKLRITMLYNIINNLANIPVHHQRTRQQYSRLSFSKIQTIEYKIATNTHYCQRLLFRGIPCRLKFVIYRHWNNEQWNQVGTTS